MRTLILSTSFAAVMGAMAMGSASAAPIVQAVVTAPAATTDVACRTVKKITYRNGMKRVVTSQQCSGPSRVVVRPGYRAPRSGITVRVR